MEWLWIAEWGGGLLGIILCAIGFSLFRRAQRLAENVRRAADEVKKEGEHERREALIKLKDELHKKRQELEAESKKERSDLDRLQTKLMQKSDLLDTREQSLETTKHELALKEREIIRQKDAVRSAENRVHGMHGDLVARLEKVSGMSREEARNSLIATLEAETRHAHEKWLSKVDEEARHTAKDRSVSIVVSAMQRHTAEIIAPHASSVVHLPSEDMKGRIIGKEGRNIKSLEMATGMEFLIGESPESISISGFNPIRREIAKRTLEKLMLDGRINPTRIEETVLQCERDVDEMIEEEGKKVVLQFNLQGIKPEIVTLLGKLYFRTSFAQNVLTHSIEVGMFARMIAEELGLPRPDIALRGGLLHDIGKALSAECEGPHALLGAEIAKRCGEDPLVVNAIAAHHEEVAFQSIYAPLVVIADTISASRPGARRETLATYIKRLEKLEELAYTFGGVKKAYALQAGREVRVVVEEDAITDDQAIGLARDLARKIEKDMAFPGQIKVNVIREKRAIEYAR